MDWAKKHTDTVIILGGILTSVLWMNSRFNDMDRRLAKIETVLILKDILPRDLATNKEEK